MSLSQKSVADHMGLSRQSISNVESGRHAMPLERLAVLLSYLELSWSDLPEVGSKTWRDDELESLKSKIEELEHGRKPVD